MIGGDALEELKKLEAVAVGLRPPCPPFAVLSVGLSLGSFSFADTLVSSEAVSASLLIRLPVDAMPNNLLLLVVVVMPFCVGFSVES